MSVVGLMVIEEMKKEATDETVAKLLFVSAWVLGLGLGLRLSPVAAPSVVVLMSARVIGLPPVKAREEIDPGEIPNAVAILVW